jgi:DNA-binding NtrC family response regulator
VNIVPNESCQSILIVETDPSRCAAARTVLESAGFRVNCASSFHEGKRLLAVDTPDMLIAGVRLGEYNGLQLVLRTRIEHPEVAAIVTSEVGDRVLEAEAERQSAAFVVRPLDNDHLLRAVSRSLRNNAPQGKSANLAAG